jgi:hypothetical protein
MFQLLSLKRSPAGIEVLVEYDAVKFMGEKVPAMKTVGSMKEAAEWIETEMMIYARKKLVAFVEHKHILSQIRSTRFPKDDMTLLSLDRCKQLCRDVLHAGAESIAKRILASEKDLRAILPLPGQASYESSVHNVEDLVMWANEILYHRREYVVEELQHAN